jgi:hypothetical protein
MSWQAKNKMLVVSLSLASAGILACIAAVYDSFVPKGSLLAFWVTMVPMGLLVAGIVAGFVWLCERGERYSERRSEQPLQIRPVEFPTESERQRHFLDEIERRRDVSLFPRMTAADNRYLTGIRGPAQPKASSRYAPPLAGQWHGQ